MSTALLFKEMKEGIWKFILGTVLLIITALAAPLLYDFIAGIVYSTPMDGLERYLGGGLAYFENHSIYLWSQWNAKNLNQIGTVMAILFGMSPIAGEVSSKTVNFLLTRPLSRRTVFYHKAAAGAILLTLSVTLSTLVLLIASAYALEGIEAGRMLVATLVTGLGMLVIYALSLFISTLINEPVKTGAIAALVTLAAAVPGWFSATRKLSLFAHMRGDEYFLEGSFPTLAVLVMILLLIGLLYMGALRFEKKQY